MGDGERTSVSVPVPRLPLDDADAQALLVLAFENSPLGITLSAVSAGPVSADGSRPRAVMINRAFAEMLGYTARELVRSEDHSRFTHEDDRASDLVHLQPAWGRERVAHWDKRYLHADGHIIWARVSVSVLRGPDQQPRYLIAQVQDITEQRTREAQLLQRAERDALTGLLNRSAFEEHAQEQIARCARYDERAALLLIDVDGLKGINDGHGHVVGDRALVAVADVLRGRLRAGDVAARLGGDEFVVVLPHASRAKAQQLAAAIEAAVVTTPVTAGAQTLALSVSVGCAEITARTRGIATPLAEADREMYANKARRREGLSRP